MSGSDGIFNVAKGRIVELHNRVALSDPTNAVLTVVLFKTIETDATLQDYDTLSAIFAGGGGSANVEANFTGYSTAPRKEYDQATISVAVPDDANNWTQVDIPNTTWTAAGGTIDNTLVKVVICYDDDSTGGNDTNLIPLVYMSFDPTTNGNDLVLQMDNNGYHRAT